MAIVKFKQGKPVVGYEPIIKFNITKNLSDVIDTASIVVTNLKELDTSDEIELYDNDLNKIFAGYFGDISKNNSINTIIINYYDSIFLDKLIQEYYDDYLIVDIIKDLIDKHTDFTFVSDFNTNFKLKNIIFDEVRLIDALNRLFTLLGCNYHLGFDKVFRLFLQKNEINEKYIDSTHDLRTTPWKKDKSKMAQYVIVRGKKIIQRTTEHLQGTGRIFKTTYLPKSLTVLINGVEKKLNIEGQTAGDYNLDEENKEIKFLNENVTDPVVSYTYENQIRAEFGDNTKKCVKLYKSYISTNREAFELCKKYLRVYADGIDYTKFKMSVGHINDFITGQLILIKDKNIEPNVYDYFQITKITYSSANELVLDVGQSPGSLYDWQKETQERIKNTEDNRSTFDFLKKFLLYSMNLKLSINTKLKVFTTEYPKNHLILTNDDLANYNSKFNLTSKLTDDELDTSKLTDEGGKVEVLL